MWLLLVVLMGIDWSDFPTEPFDAQKAYIQDCADPSLQYVVSFCGLQAGKTISEADGGKTALYGPNPIMLPVGPRGRTPMEVWLVSKSYALAETLFETFRWRTPQDMWATEKQMRRWGVTKGDRYTHWLVPRVGTDDPCPIKLRVRTASDPESLRATNTLGLAICDELPWWKEKAWLNIQGRGIVVKTKYLIAGTPNGRNFAYKTLALPGGYRQGIKGAIPRSDPQIAVHTWTSADNPHADKNHILRLKKIFGVEYAKQELEGLFTDSIGYVYPMFDRTIHMPKPPSDDPDDYEVRVGGIDPGYRDAYAVGVWCKTKKGDDGKWYQVEEIHRTGESSMRMAPQILLLQNRWKVSKWFVDKARPSDRQILQDFGVRAYPNLVIHGESDKRTIPPMIAVCRELLRQGRLFIGPEHEYTAEEFERYHYPDEVEERERNTNDIPVDFYNHHLDQMRYCICSVEEIPSIGPRYRSGVDQMPRGTADKAKKPVGALSATPKDYYAAQDRRFDEQERGCRRQES